MSDYLSYDNGDATDASHDYLPLGYETDDQVTGALGGAPATYGESMTMPAAATAPSASELTVQAPYLEEVRPSTATMGGARRDISEVVLDVEVPVEVHFGDASLTVEEFLELGAGSVVELDRQIQQPIDLRVRGKLVARGQLVTINGNYGLRITETVQS